MQNLEQIRAKQALTDAKGLDKGAVSKLPALIMNNGLLATTAFCITGGGENRKGMKESMEKVADHLAQRGLISPRNPIGEPLKAFIQSLTEVNSIQLQQATAEALAYLGYLKRFSEEKGN